MNANVNLDPLTTPHYSSRKRLFDEHAKFGSWRKVSRARRVNVWYAHRFALKGIVPQNKKIRRRLGIGVTLNQLLQLPIQDMPPAVLRWALENREVMDG